MAANGLEAGAVEDFWSDLGNVAASALPVIGGAVGSIIAPGVGTAIGSGLGSVAGSALHAAIGSGQSSQPAQPAPAAAAPQYAMPSYQVPPYQMPASPYGAQYPYPYAQPGLGQVSGATSQQSAALLLQLLMQPQLLQALMQMLMGSAGSPTVPVPTASAAPAASSAPAFAAAAPSNPATTAVPVSAFTNLLGTLATQASEAYNAERAVGPSPGPYHYGAGPWGGSVDLASPESRAGALMNLLRESAPIQQAARNRRRRSERLTTLVEALRRIEPPHAVV